MQLKAIQLIEEIPKTICGGVQLQIRSCFSNVQPFCSLLKASYLSILYFAILQTTVILFCRPHTYQNVAMCFSNCANRTNLAYLSFIFQASYLSNRGNVLLKLARWQDAEKDITASIELQSDNAKVIFSQYCITVVAPQFFWLYCTICI